MLLLGYNDVFITHNNNINVSDITLLKWCVVFSSKSHLSNNMKRMRIDLKGRRFIYIHCIFHVFIYLMAWVDAWKGLFTANQVYAVIYFDVKNIFK